MPNLHRILVVRLGAMGDIIHALPAVATLKYSFPGTRLTWAVEPRWTDLLEDNPFVDRIVPIRRGRISRAVPKLARTPRGVLRFCSRFPGSDQVRTGRLLVARPTHLRFPPHASPGTPRRFSTRTRLSATPPT